MNEQEKYHIIKSLVEHKGNKKRAALQIGCSSRHINRLIQKYKLNGKAAFLHGNRGRKPSHAISESLKSDIITLYNNKYFDATFSYACELLEQEDGIKISPSALTKILYQEYILSPRTTRVVKNRILKKLKAEQKNKSSKKHRDEIQTLIVNIEDAHSRRPRCAYFGEMLQMDASLHTWFGNEKSQLHIAIDDSTGTIVGAYFDQQETLNGYYHVFHQILTHYGIPAMFYTDRRTVFEYKRNDKDKVEKDTFTQFSYACHQLGVQIKTTSVPQAKGRVERAFQTLQQRLPIALRLAGVTEINTANVFLASYLQKYNVKFSLPINHTKSVFETQPTSEKINQTLAVLAERTIDSGHSVKFNNEYYKTMDARGHQVHYLRGTKGLLIKTFDNQLLFTVKDNIHELEKIPKREEKSKEFDFISTIPKPSKRNIPSAKHPWRNETFLKYRNFKQTEQILMC